MEAFEERNKNSKIIRNILSGALTDPDEKNAIPADAC
jgi:hypothetical protein